MANQLGINSRFLSRKERAKRTPKRPTSSLATNTGLRPGKGKPGDNNKFMKPLSPLNARMKATAQEVITGQATLTRKNVSDLEKEGGGR